MKVTMTRHGSSVDKLRMNLALHLQPFKRASSLLVTRFIIVVIVNIKINIIIVVIVIAFGIARLQLHITYVIGL